MKTPGPVEMSDAVIYELAKLMSGPMGLYASLLELRQALGITPLKAMSHNECAARIRMAVYQHRTPPAALGRQQQ